MRTVWDTGVRGGRGTKEGKREGVVSRSPGSGAGSSLPGDPQGSSTPHPQISDPQGSCVMSPPPRPRLWILGILHVPPQPPPAPAFGSSRILCVPSETLDPREIPGPPPSRLQKAPPGTQILGDPGRSGPQQSALPTDVGPTGCWGLKTSPSTLDPHRSQRILFPQSVLPSSGSSQIPGIWDLKTSPPSLDPWRARLRKKTFPQVRDPHRSQTIWAPKISPFPLWILRDPRESAPRQP